MYQRKNVQIQLSRKQKLFIPISILAAILIFLGSIILYTSYNKISTLQVLKEKVDFSTKIAKTLHHLQKERGLSCGFVLDKNSTFKERLTQQIKLTDTTISELEQFIAAHQKNQPKISRYISELLSPLSSIRSAIYQNDLTYNEIIKSYTYITDSFLQKIAELATQSHVPEITAHLLSYSSLLYMKEYRGIERALGVTICSQKKIDLKPRILFTSILSMENEKEKAFFIYASKNIKNFYTHEIQKPYFSQIVSMRKQIIYKSKETENLDAVTWYETISRTLDSLNTVSLFIERKIKLKIDIELNHIRTVFILVNLLTALSLMIFILMIIALAKLIEDERRLRLVSDKYIISSVTDLKGRIIDVSQAFCEISGYTKEELVGRNHNIIRHPDMPKEVFRELWRKIKNGDGWSGKVKNLKKDGGYYWVYAHIEPLYNANGFIDSYISIRLDITESELLQEKVKEEEEKNRITQELMQQQSRLAQMGEMINMIAHQWRQPLSAITATATTLHLSAKRGTHDQEKSIELAQKISGFAQHLSTTINDFRNFFKSAKNKTQTNYTTILESVLSIIESTLKNNNISLDIIEKDVSSTFETYENELKQVILNLIKNAEDALLEKEIASPHIVIEIERETLKVKDNAGGIPEDIMPRIFDPYFSTKLQKDGTGLGLYMSKIIVEEHCGGTLSVENGEKGAVFTITLSPKQPEISNS
jgi:PAS domain S-box-containing protein